MKGTPTAGDGQGNELGVWGASGFVRGRDPVQDAAAPVFAASNFGRGICLITFADVIAGVAQLDYNNSTIVVDASGGDVPIALPSYSRFMTRLWFTIIRVDTSANKVSVLPRPTFADTINGTANPFYITYPYVAFEVTCYDDSEGTHQGLGHGLYHIRPTGAVSDVEARRMTTPLTPLVATDVNLTLGASWGSGPGATASWDAGSNDLLGQLNIAVGAGTTGMVTQPTAVITFKDGAWPVAPLYTVTPVGINTTFLRYLSSTTTTLTLQLNNIPIAGSTFRAIMRAEGRR